MLSVDHAEAGVVAPASAGASASSAVASCSSSAAAPTLNDGHSYSYTLPSYPMAWTYPEVVIISDDEDTNYTLDHGFARKDSLLELHRPKKRLYSSGSPNLSDATTSTTTTTTATSRNSFDDDYGLVSPATSVRPTPAEPRLKRRKVSASQIKTLHRPGFDLTYVPPQLPVVKATEVPVDLVSDSRACSANFDDADGHYIVNPNTDFADRYVIRSLLGQGTYGKVVAAVDKQSQRMYAIKIIRAVPKYRDASKVELRVLSTLARYDLRRTCVGLRGCFDYRNHICIVTDLLGLSVYDFMKANGFLPFPGSHVQHFAVQLLKSTAFLHDLNLIHTDLKPENILLACNDYCEMDYHGTRTKRWPRRTRRVLDKTAIHIIDFGSAIFDDEYHASVVSTRHYRAPEVILGTGWSFPCDLWSIGCILVEFCTGEALFQTHDNVEHLALMEAILGHPVTADLAMDRTGRPTAGGARMFNSRGRLDYPTAETKASSRKYVNMVRPLGDQLREVIPAFNRNRQFWDAFLDLLRRIFVYDPTHRISAKQALAHPWFQMSLADDGSS